MKYFHAHRVIPGLCKGHMRCMRACPTQAIRVRHGRATISEELCVDCGACMQVCPENAIEPIADLVGEISDFTYKVVVPSASLYSQFSPDIHPYIIHQALRQLGFDEVVDVSISSAALVQTLVNYMESYTGRLPLISSYCPSIVRLIQVKYPDLVDQVVPLDAPREVTAREIRRTFPEKLGLAPEDIGIVLLVTCPAKIVAIKQPAEEGARSNFNAVVPISDAYSILQPKVRRLKENFDKSQVPDDWTFITGWGRTGSIVNQAARENWLSVSGLDSVIQILDDIENGRLRHVEFIEAMAHSAGCIGGPFCIENPWVARHTGSILRDKYETHIEVDEEYIDKRMKEGAFMLDNHIRPRSTEFFDTDLETSIKRMKERERVFSKLPQIDCGCCGSPTCMAFAEDFVRGEVKLTDCVFLGAGNKRESL